MKPTAGEQICVMNVIVGNVEAVLVLKSQTL